MVHLMMKGPNTKDSLKMKGKMVCDEDLLCLVSPQTQFWSLELKNSTAVINQCQGKIWNSNQYSVE